MNDATKKLLKQYSIPAIIGFVLLGGGFLIGGITEGNMNFVFQAPVMAVFGIFYFVGFYQSFFVDKMKIGGKSIFNQNPGLWALYFALVLVVFWIVGDVKAFIRIIDSTKE